MLVSPFIGFPDAFSISGPPLAQWPGHPLGPGGIMGPAAPGIFWSILMFATWFAVMVLLFLLIRYLALLIRAGQAAHHPAETPLDILKKRYARGEIDREEFERRKQDILQ